jgi:hypothetical protein
MGADGCFYEYLVEGGPSGYSWIVYTHILKKSLREFSEVTLRQDVTTEG